MSKVLQFRNAAGRKPELLVYGDIYDWWGEVQSREFAEQLQAITAETIDVRINSNGGSVFAAQAIYSSLKRHPAKINVYIDGIAASAATIIMSAGDWVYMPENAMLMVHNPMVGLHDSFNADELREFADALDAVQKTILAAYREKTGLDDETLIELLSKDRYITAAEAKELGFVDEIGPALKIAASRKGSSVIINGLTIQEDRYKRLPEDWRNAVESPLNQSGASGKTTEKERKVMTLDEFKAQHPELYKAAMAAGQEQERARIKAIDEMVMPGYEALAAKAKFETGLAPEAFAVELIKAEKAAKERFLAERQKDAEEVNGVEQGGDPGADGEDAKLQAVANAMAGGFNARARTSGKI